jgi:outer membrane protein assembly factor BamC
MKTKIRLLIIGAVVVNMSACTYIKNLFPDKEKDYQFTTEIPPLVLPPDLSGDSTAKVPTASATEATEAPASDTGESTSAASPTETVPDIDRKLIRVELLDSDQESKRLHITAPVAIAWRMVGKALSRNSIEVTNRNQEERFFHVQYDPNRKEVEDGSVWDEVVFFFKGIDVTEQEYVLKLAGDNQQTDVFIMDKDQKPATDKTSLSLLTLLHDTMKADLAK